MCITDFGCAIVYFSMPDREGFVNEITLGYNELRDYFDNRDYLGVIVGRCAGRIRNSRFKIGGETYNVAPNEGKNHLHGGITGFNKVLWNSEIIQENDVAGVKFTYTSKDGDEGYPGNLDMAVKYLLNEKNELIFEYNATTDKTTPINLTNHAYWNLAGPDSGPVFGHEFKFNCNKYLPADSELLPTGEIKNVKGTYYDFIQRKKLGDVIDKVPGGFDNCMVVSDSFEESQNNKAIDIKSAKYTGSGGFEIEKLDKDINFVVSVYEPKSGRLMDVYTTKPGIHFYTGDSLNELKGRYGIIYGKNSGFALETEFFPDAVNIENFGSPLLNPGEEYHHVTIHRFSTL